jgi:hypothetical protein
VGQGQVEGRMKLSYNRIVFPDGAGGNEATRGLRNTQLGLTAENSNA